MPIALAPLSLAAPPPRPGAPSAEPPPGPEPGFEALVDRPGTAAAPPAPAEESAAAPAPEEERPADEADPEEAVALPAWPPAAASGGMTPRPQPDGAVLAEGGHAQPAGSTVAAEQVSLETSQPDAAAPSAETGEDDLVPEETPASPGFRRPDGRAAEGEATADGGHEEPGGTQAARASAATRQEGAPGPAPEQAAPPQGDKPERAGDNAAPHAVPDPVSPESADPSLAEAAARPGLDAPVTAPPAPAPDGSPRPAVRAETAAPQHPAAPTPDRPAADAVVRTRDGQIEVTLNPVELGRVTLLLGAEGDPGRLGLYVERPETADLIRRHSDQLLRDLRENGMPEARLDLLRQDGQGQHRSGGFRQDPRGPSGAEAPRAGPADWPPAPATSLSRLDIRL